MLLLYRDDVYDPASSQPGTMEITVAKNRNGPLPSEGRWILLDYDAGNDMLDDAL